MTVLDKIMTDIDRDRQSYLNVFRKEKRFNVKFPHVSELTSGSMTMSSLTPVTDKINLATF